MAETRTVHDPFLGQDVQISNRLVDRLRGKYASGPHLPNGNPEFGWRQFQAPPIQHEAAAVIEALILALENARRDILALRPRSDTGSKRARQIEASAEQIKGILDRVAGSKQP